MIATTIAFAVLLGPMQQAGPCDSILSLAIRAVEASASDYLRAECAANTPFFAGVAFGLAERRSQGWSHANTIAAFVQSDHGVLAVRSVDDLAALVTISDAFAQPRTFNSYESWFVLLRATGLVERAARVVASASEIRGAQRHWLGPNAMRQIRPPRVFVGVDTARATFFVIDDARLLRASCVSTSSGPSVRLQVVGEHAVR